MPPIILLPIPPVYFLHPDFAGEIPYESDFVRFSTFVTSY